MLIYIFSCKSVRYFTNDFFYDIVYRYKGENTNTLFFYIYIMLQFYKNLVMNTIKLQNLSEGGGQMDPIEAQKAEQAAKLKALEAKARELAADWVDAADIDTIVSSIQEGAETIGEEMKAQEKQLVLDMIQQYGMQVADGKTDINLVSSWGIRGRKKKFSVIADRNDGTFFDTKTEMLSNTAIQGLIEKVGISPEEVTTALASAEDVRVANIEAEKQHEAQIAAGKVQRWPTADQIKEHQYQQGFAAETTSDAMDAAKERQRLADQTKASDDRLIALGKEAAEKQALIAKAEAAGESDKNAGDLIAEALVIETEEAQKMKDAMTSFKATVASVDLSDLPKEKSGISESLQALVNAIVPADELKAEIWKTELSVDGFSGPNTKRGIQMALNKMTGKNLDIDGKIGDLTMAAANSMKEVDINRAYALYVDPNKKTTTTQA